MRRIIGIAAAGAMAVGLVACGLGKSKGVTYKDSSFGITVELPGGWSKVSEDESEGLTTVDFENGDLSATVMYMEEEGMGDLGLTGEDFLEGMMDEFVGSDATLETVHEGSIVVSGVKGHEKTFRGVIEGSEGIGRVIALMNGDKMLLLMFTEENVEEFSSGDKDHMKEFIKGVTLK